MLSVADARVEEDQGATLDFVVSLSRSRSRNEATSVEYATSDGTARADEDYTRRLRHTDLRGQRDLEDRFGDGAR